MRNPAVIAYGALVIVESIWWFATLAVIGGLLGLGGSPLPWLAVLVLLVFGAAAAWLFGGAKGDVASMAIYQAVIAVVVVYFAVAAVSLDDTWSFKVAWPVDMFGGTYSGEGVADLIIGLIAAGVLWYRSQHLVGGGGVRRQLSRGFKVGTAFIAVGLLIEISVVRSDIGIAPLLIPFFAASLIGLAASRLPQSEDTGNASWPVVIGISVLGILGIGAVGGLLTGRYGAYGVRGLVNVWTAFVDALLWVLRYPIEWAIWAMLAIIQWLRERLNPEDVEEEPLPPGQPSEDIASEVAEKAEKGADFAVDALRWPLSILLIVVLFFVLVFAYKRFAARGGDKDKADRESIRGDADAKADMMKLLSSLVPSWMKGGKKRSLWKWPEGEKGVGEAFLLYFDTLTHAIKRGMVFDPNVTPNERISALAVFLPGAPVDTVTTRFNAACYGAEPTEISEIERLRSAIEEAAKRPKPSDE
ncbi:MAG TPA: hypothetical protein EYQ61_07250 [Dehalococcoidia bacterium]|nr:hypothetical protein [Dehalococcoidia bacterium]